MSIAPQDVGQIAHLARLELTEDESARFGEQLGRILDYVQQLQAVDVSGVEPYISAAATANVFRDDAVVPGLPRDAALGGAPAQDSEGFVVPKVVGGSDGEA